MGRSAEVFQVLKEAEAPLTCREICERAKLDEVEAKSVAAVLAAYKKSGTVVEGDSKICSVTGHKAKTYSLRESQVPEVHQNISSNDHVVTITFENGSVRVDAYPRGKRVA